MSKKNKKALRGVMEWKEYASKLNDEERQWVTQFYNEYYANGSYNHEQPILHTKEQISEANRNYNALYRDAFNVSRMLNRQEEITEDQRQIYELASDEKDWVTVFDQEGEEAAMNTIMEQAIRDLNARQDKKVVLSRFYVKMNRLKKEVQKEKRKQR